ncbi:MAG: IctB family putative bicarbonate transporter [Microcystaceae cyanobacterium]
MAAVWHRLALFPLLPSQWRSSSLICRLMNLFAQWRTSSWLLQWSEPLGALLLSLVFIFAPFVSTTLIGLLLIAIIGYWLLLIVSDPQQEKITLVHFLILTYWLIAGVSVILSPVKMAALSGWIKFTLYLGSYVLASKIMQSPRLLNRLITIILFVALVVSIYGIRQEFYGVEQLATWNDPTSELAGNTRVYSYLGNPNLLAAYLLPAIALSGAAVLVWQGLLPKALAITMLLFNSACLYFTDSRGGWIAMVALAGSFTFLLYLWWRPYLSPFWRQWLLPLVLGTCTALGIIAFITVEPLRLRIMSIFAGREDSSNNFRMNVWSAVIEMIKARPLIGIGPGNEAFNQIYPLFMRPKYSALSAYSVFLETAVETGLIGLSVFLGFILTAIAQGMVLIHRLREKNRIQGIWVIAAIAGMIGLLTHGLVDTVWYRPQISTLWWFLVAIITSQISALGQRKDLKLDAKVRQKVVS